MASWTTPPTHSTGDLLSAPDWNAIADNETFLYQKPYGLYYNSTGKACLSGATTQVTLGGRRGSNYGFTISSNNVFVPLTGLYEVSFAVSMATAAGSGANTLWALAYHNGAAVGKGATVPSYAQGGASSAGACKVLCNAGDYIGLFLGNLSGSTMTTVNDAAQTFLHVNFIGSN